MSAYIINGNISLPDVTTTQGELLTVNASGNLNAILGGTTGQVLTSAGPGNEPSFQNQLGLGTNGIVTKTGASTFTTRTVAAGTSGILTITNGDGVSGNPTVEVTSTRGFSMYKTGNQSITSSASSSFTLSNWTTSPFGYNQIGTGFNTSTGQFTVQEDGSYAIAATVVWAVNSVGRRIASIVVDGNVRTSISLNPGLVVDSANSQPLVENLFLRSYLSSGQVVTITVSQNSGANQNVMQVDSGISVRTNFSACLDAHF